MIITNITEDGSIEWPIYIVKMDRNFTAITGWVFISEQTPSDMVIKVVLQNLCVFEFFYYPGCRRII